jgi:hypothetical protein
MSRTGAFCIADVFCTFSIEATTAILTNAFAPVRRDMPFTFFGAGFILTFCVKAFSTLLADTLTIVGIHGGKPLAGRER